MRLTMTMTEVAALIGVSRSTAYELADRGELPVVWYGRRKLVPVGQLAARLGVDVETVWRAADFAVPPPKRHAAGQHADRGQPSNRRPNPSAQIQLSLDS